MEKEIDLKKQSQFAPAQIDAKSYSKGIYDNKPACGVEKNKANQSQSPAFVRKSGAGIEKGQEQFCLGWNKTWIPAFAGMTVRVGNDSSTRG